MNRVGSLFLFLAVALSVSAAPPASRKFREYKPCMEKPVFEAPLFERPLMDRARIEKPLFDRSVIEKPKIVREIRQRPVIEKPQMELAEFEVPCWDNGATSISSVEVEKFDRRFLQAIPFRRQSKEYTTFQEIHHSPFRRTVKAAPATEY